MTLRSLVALALLPVVPSASALAGFPDKGTRT